MNTTTVNAQRDGRVLTVRLDNPPRKLMTFGMIKELDALKGKRESKGLPCTPYFSKNLCWFFVKNRPVLRRPPHCPHRSPPQALS